MTAREARSFALALRQARQARRLSQLALALASDVSARHLSWLETGRAAPSRDMVLRLADSLLLPRAQQNALLHAAGFAPVFPASALASDALEPLRAVLTEMVTRHAPYPALLCDRHWTVRDANVAARHLLLALGDDGTGEANLVRLVTQGAAAPRVIANLPEVVHELHARLRLEALGAGDDGVLAELLALLAMAARRHPSAAPAAPRRPLTPLELNTPGGTWRLYSTIAHFGTSEDITVRDLRLELLFPADDATRAGLVALARA